MKANYNVTGNDRKALVAAIEKLTGDKAVYMRMPTCAYEIGDITVDKEGSVTCEDADKLERIIHSLIADGFTPEDTEEVESDDEATGLTVSLPLDKVAVAILAFGINSGAYQAEILRAGIMSIDPGQMEAGRALGLGYWRTMLKIILPQAIRNVLPALGNEFIVLMKDTSIVGYIALCDLAKGGDIIRSQTYSVYTPYLTVAAIYLILVMTFTWLLGKLERHLRNTGADVVHNDS